MFKLEPVDAKRIVRVLDGLARIPLRFGKGQIDKIGDAIRQGVAVQFETEGQAAGGWPALAASTVAQRRRLGFPGAHMILQRTRELKTSWTDRQHPDHSQQSGAFAGMLVLTVASEDERAAWLWRGNPEKNLPPRPQALLGERELERIDSVIIRELEQSAHRVQ